jgi:polyisoprenoid-binding protein YceI
MTDRYRFDPDRSRFTVQGFATGILAFVAHSPTFAVREFSGGAAFTFGQDENVRLRLAARAHALQLLDNVSDTDRTEIENRMRGEVLEVARYPEITFEGADSAARKLAEDRIQFTLTGPLTLHGVTRAIQTGAVLHTQGDAVRFTGEFLLAMSEFGIRPVTALGGAIRLKDALKVAFDLVGHPA